ncbi:exosortase A [Vibrio alfacsensis]|uniref:exosortase A n=1 Tax=Vibrio alfacsensis TaxID=1074311 RepID=UPI004068270B
MTSQTIFRFALPLIAWGVVYFGSIESMLSVWSNSKTYEHGFFIIPISLWLAWRKREQIEQIPIQTSWLPVMLLVFPTLCWMVGIAADVALFEHISAVLSLQLILWAIIGTPLAKLLFFPIFYLIFCIPFGEELIPYLQLVTADITVFALQLSNIPVYREGLYLAIPNGLFEVAEACSGIRFLISSIALGALFAYLNFSKWWKIVAFVGFSFIFPIIANGIRAYGIVLIGHLTDMEHATGADHLVYGWVFFTFVIGIIFYIASMFSDKPEHHSDCYGNATAKHSTPMFVPFIAVIWGILASQWGWQNTLYSDQEVIAEPIELPKQLVPIESSFWGIHFPNAQQSVLSTTEDNSTEVYIAKSQYSKNQAELISHSNDLFDKNYWSLLSNSSVNLGSSGNAKVTDIISKHGVNRKIMYWYCINNYCTANTAKIKLIRGLYVLSKQPVSTSFTAVLVDNIDSLEFENLLNTLNQ